MKEKKIIDVIKTRIGRGIPSGFTGLGIILVEDRLDGLPLAPLLDGVANFDQYKSEEEIISFLIGVSGNDDRRHDGFHIISQNLGLVKISQYFSPEIPQDFKDTIFNVGSRYRAAQYGSLYKNVCSVIIVSQSGSVSVAKNGSVESI